MVALRASGLLAGMTCFDLLLNSPHFSSISPLASLAVPSIDLLVVLAILLSAAHGNERVQTGFAAGVAALVAFFLGWQAFRRWGASDGVLRLALLAIAAVGTGAASFFLSMLVLRGFRDAVLRSLFLLAAAGCAVVQALLGVRIFASSVVPVMLGFR
jgi:hypothetical protein